MGATYIPRVLDQEFCVRIRQHRETYPETLDDSVMLDVRHKLTLKFLHRVHKSYRDLERLCVTASAKKKFSCIAYDYDWELSSVSAAASMFGLW